MVCGGEDLLHDDVVTAHDVLSKMIGPVKVSVGGKQGRTHTWRAQVNLDPVPAMVELGRPKDCPTTHSLEFLRVCSWTTGSPLTIQVQERPNYQRIAAEAVKLHDAGSPINRIAIVMKTDPSTVKQAIKWGATNDMRFIPSADFSVRRNHPNSKTAKIGSVVVRLREAEGLSFDKIAEKLKATAATASRAFKQFYSEKNYDAASKGKRLDTAENRRKISPETINKIRHLVAEGNLSKRAIAREVGVTPWTVRHEAKRLSDIQVDARLRPADAPNLLHLSAQNAGRR